MQEALRNNEFSLRVVEALLNWEDVRTQSLEKDRLDSFMLQMPLSRGEGRPAAVASSALSLLSASSLHLPTRTARRVEETTVVVGSGAAACKFHRSTLCRIPDAGSPTPQQLEHMDAGARLTWKAHRREGRWKTPDRAVEMRIASPSGAGQQFEQRCNAVDTCGRDGGSTRHLTSSGHVRPDC